MPAFNDILQEVGAATNIFDTKRRQYLQQVFDVTGRNVIIYYSGFLQKLTGHQGIDERDKNGFMATIHKLDRTKGLDLFLHTPGGELAAVEALVFYLRQMFGNNIRAIVPQIAMSGGTMLALSCREIIMGKHSSLGPIDPQFQGVSAHGLLEEWDTAYKEIQADPNKGYMWHEVLQKYTPTLIGDCQKSVAWANDMTTAWLTDCMFEGEADAKAKADRIVAELSDHSKTKAHDRRLSVDDIRQLGVRVTALEDNDALQDAVMSVHHVTMMTFERTTAYKIVENQNGVGYISGHNPILIPAGIRGNEL